MIMQLYNERKQEIKARLKEFTKVSGDNVFYELCFCLLTPGSSALLCQDKVEKLKEADFLNKNVNPARLIYPVRFFNNKARNLLLAKKDYGTILEKIDNVKDSYQLREWLVGNVRGLGYKESSHFLRNIGKGKGLAILDRHILRNIAQLGIINETPSHVYKRQYLDIEAKVLDYSKSIGIAAEELDLLLWAKETGYVFK